MKPKRLLACLLLPMLAVVGRCEGLPPDVCALDDYTERELVGELIDRGVEDATDWLDDLLDDD